LQTNWIHQIETSEGWTRWVITMHGGVVLVYAARILRGQGERSAMRT
jgi:hypothetical protein